MKMLGIVGSKRKNCNTSSLVLSALESSKGDGIETEAIFLRRLFYKRLYRL
ncbi:hypothetical protein [uncultured Ilyobacter sp.]|uniref:hypothetical protein n=1 Tax=uncultured Ilyobacter sp. TaxID=544433 RepID=UPI0029F4B364|nr:hypothetical protein [uncultured Ilyobacter sp.]